MYYFAVKVPFIPTPTYIEMLQLCFDKKKKNIQTKEWKEKRNVNEWIEWNAEQWIEFKKYHTCNFFSFVWKIMWIEHVAYGILMLVYYTLAIEKFYK